MFTWAGLNYPRAIASSGNEMVSRSVALFPDYKERRAAIVGIRFTVRVTGFSNAKTRYSVDEK